MNTTHAIIILLLAVVAVASTAWIWLDISGRVPSARTATGDLAVSVLLPPVVVGSWVFLALMVAGVL